MMLSVIPGKEVRRLQNKAFARFAKKADIDNVALCSAIREAERGLVAADLGGDVIKQRIARRGQGKSGGFRVGVVFNVGALARGIASGTLMEIACNGQTIQ
jgi:hypothetical protein